MDANFSLDVWRILTIKEAVNCTICHLYEERIVKLEISDDQKSYELTNAIKEIQELRIQDHMKSNLIYTILQSQTEILFALNLTKVKLDKQESEHNATKLELEQLKTNF